MYLTKFISVKYKFLRFRSHFTLLILDGASIVYGRSGIYDYSSPADLHCFVHCADCHK